MNIYNLSLSKKLEEMVGYFENLTFLFGKENVKNGIYGLSFLRKSGCDWVSVGPCIIIFV